MSFLTFNLAPTTPADCKSCDSFAANKYYECCTTCSHHADSTTIATGKIHFQTFQSEFNKNPSYINHIYFIFFQQTQHHIQQQQVFNRSFTYLNIFYNLIKIIFSRIATTTGPNSNSSHSTVSAATNYATNSPTASCTGKLSLSSVFILLIAPYMNR